MRNAPGKVILKRTSCRAEVGFTVAGIVGVVVAGEVGGRGGGEAQAVTPMKKLRANSKRLDMIFSQLSDRFVFRQGFPNISFRCRYEVTDGS